MDIATGREARRPEGGPGFNPNPPCAMPSVRGCRASDPYWNFAPDRRMTPFSNSGVIWSKVEILWI
jgi:hypothetical protein